MPRKDVRGLDKEPRVVLVTDARPVHKTYKVQSKTSNMVQLRSGKQVKAESIQERRPKPKESKEEPPLKKRTLDRDRAHVVNTPARDTEHQDDSQARSATPSASEKDVAAFQSSRHAVNVVLSVEAITDPEQLALIERDEYILGHKLPTPGRAVEPKWMPPEINDHKFDIQCGGGQRREPTPVQTAELPSPPRILKKGKKSAAQKDEEFMQNAMLNPDGFQRDMNICIEKGSGGSPTYDKAGFELDYGKVMKVRSGRGGRIDFDKDRSDQVRMAEIFFGKEMAPRYTATSPLECEWWKDKVSRDLNVPFHKTGIADFEEWEKRGFPKAKREDYDRERISVGEKERLTRLMTGSAFRKD